MSEKIFTAASLKELGPAADYIIQLAEEKNVVAFFGEMGSGKTTLIKEVCARLGVAGQTASPSFGLVNEYSSAENSPVYHFDFYRIKDTTEAFDLGYEDYFFSGNLCLVEWPEKILYLLPANFVKVRIEAQEKLRIIRIQK